MTEISVTENLIAEYRNNYNSQVKSYLNYTKKFPTNIILNLLGYNIKNYEYLNYEISSSSPKELWK